MLHFRAQKGKVWKSLVSRGQSFDFPPDIIDIHLPMHDEDDVLLGPSNIPEERPAASHDEIPGLDEHLAELVP